MMPPFSDALLIKRLCVADKRTRPAYTECVSRVCVACVCVHVHFLRATQTRREAAAQRREVFVHGNERRLRAHLGYNRIRGGELINRVESITRFTSARGLPIN